MTKVVPGARILLVEDDGQVASVIRRHIIDSGIKLKVHYDVVIVECAEDAISRVSDGDFHLCIVDLTIPKQRGTWPAESVGRYLVAVLAKRNNLGIIIFSSSDKGESGSDLLQIGADDYIEKSDPIEFLCDKVFSLWRRIYSLSLDGVLASSRREDRSFRINGLRFDVGTPCLFEDDGDSIQLGVTEYEFIKNIVVAKDNELDFDTFKAFVLKRSTFVDRKSFDNTIFRLRKKLGGRFPIERRQGGVYHLPGVEKISG